MNKRKTVRLLVSVNVRLVTIVLILLTVQWTLASAWAQEPSTDSSIIKRPKNKVIATVTVGSAPLGIVVTPDTSYVYVANAGSLSLSKIATATNTVVNTIALTYSPGALAITPDGDTLYVANYYANSVTVVDTASDTVATTLSLTEGPKYLAMSPDGSEVYVLCNYQETNGIIAIIDTATNQVSSTTINVGGYPQALVFTADGNTAYEVNAPTSSVAVIDTASKTVSRTISTKQQYAGGLALLPNATKLYVTGDSDFVAVLNTGSAGNKQVVLPQGISFSLPALTPNGRYLYDPSGNSQLVFMIDTKTNQVIGNPITVGNEPWQIAISSNAKRAYVTNYQDGTVSVINIAL